MGKSLYRAYRSTSFDEIIGQDHITRLLKHSLKSGNIRHAYLLSGPRGVGKTSVARIMAYAINDQPYQLEATNLDIIEIDAASNRRIDEIREIREKVAIAPSVGTYKVYIIDEVHMLTREAFNALLKTLEEPPAHVVFILATTETHKVPETIISRCIRLQFHPIETSILADHLQMIAKKEKINLTPEAAHLLAEHGHGSFRDAISLLEQAAQTGKEVSEDTVITLLGMASTQQIKSIVEAINSGSAKELSNTLIATFTQGASVEAITGQLIDHYRTELLESNIAKETDSRTINLQQRLLEVQSSAKPRIALELCLIQYALETHNSQVIANEIQPTSITNEPGRVEGSESQNKSDNKKKPIANISVHTPIVHKSIKKSKKIKRNEEDVTEIWDKSLQDIKQKNNTLYGIARMATVSQEDGEICLGFSFNFHMKQINEPKNKTIILAILQKYAGYDVQLRTYMVDRNEPEPTVELKDPVVNESSALQSVSNIFGGHEVLES